MRNAAEYTIFPSFHRENEVEGETGYDSDFDDAEYDISPAIYGAGKRDYDIAPHVIMEDEEYDILPGKYNMRGGEKVEDSSERSAKRAMETIDEERPLDMRGLQYPLHLVSNKAETRSSDGHSASFSIKDAATHIPDSAIEVFAKLTHASIPYNWVASSGSSDNVTAARAFTLKVTRPMRIKFVADSGTHDQSLMIKVNGSLILSGHMMKNNPQTSHLWPSESSFLNDVITNANKWFRYNFNVDRLLKYQYGYANENMGNEREIPLLSIDQIPTHVMTDSATPWTLGANSTVRLTFGHAHADYTGLHGTTYTERVKMSKILDVVLTPTDKSLQFLTAKELYSYIERTINEPAYRLFNASKMISFNVSENYQTSGDAMQKRVQVKATLDNDGVIVNNDLSGTESDCMKFRMELPPLFYGVYTGNYGDFPNGVYYDPTRTDGSGNKEVLFSSVAGQSQPLKHNIWNEDSITINNTGRIYGSISVKYMDNDIRYYPVHVLDLSDYLDGASRYSTMGRREASSGTTHKHHPTTMTEPLGGTTGFSYREDTSLGVPSGDDFASATSIVTLQDLFEGYINGLCYLFRNTFGLFQAANYQELVQAMRGPYHINTRSWCFRLAYKTGGDFPTFHMKDTNPNNTESEPRPSGKGGIVIEWNELNDWKTAGGGNLGTSPAFKELAIRWNDCMFGFYDHDHVLHESDTKQFYPGLLWYMYKRDDRGSATVPDNNGLKRADILPVTHNDTSDSTGMSRMYINLKAVHLPFYGAWYKNEFETKEYMNDDGETNDPQTLPFISETGGGDKYLLGVQPTSDDRDHAEVVNNFYCSAVIKRPDTITRTSGATHMEWWIPMFETSVHGGIEVQTQFPKQMPLTAESLPFIMNHTLQHYTLGVYQPAMENLFGVEILDDKFGTAVYTFKGTDQTKPELLYPWHATIRCLTSDGTNGHERNIGVLFDYGSTLQAQVGGDPASTDEHSFCISFRPRAGNSPKLYSEVFEMRNLVNPPVSIDWNDGMTTAVTITKDGVNIAEDDLDMALYEGARGPKIKTKTTKISEFLHPMDISEVHKLEIRGLAGKIKHETVSNGVPEFTQDVGQLGGDDSEWWMLYDKTNPGETAEVKWDVTRETDPHVMVQKTLDLPAGNYTNPEDLEFTLNYLVQEEPTLFWNGIGLLEKRTGYDQSKIFTIKGVPSTRKLYLGANLVPQYSKRTAMPFKVQFESSQPEIASLFGHTDDMDVTLEISELQASTTFMDTNEVVSVYSDKSIDVVNGFNIARPAGASSMYPAASGGVVDSVKALYIETDFAQSGLDTTSKKSMLLAMVPKDGTVGEYIHFQPTIETLVQCAHNVRGDSKPTLDFRIVDQDRNPIAFDSSKLDSEPWILNVTLQWKQEIKRSRLRKSAVETIYH